MSKPKYTAKKGIKPNKTKKKYKVKISEKSFQRSLISALRLSGIYVYRQNVISGEFGGRFLSSGIPVGSSDLVAIFKPHGTVIFIECKSNTGKLRETQILFKQEIEKYGALYFVATPNQSLQDTLRDLHSLVEKKCESISNSYKFKLK